MLSSITPLGERARHNRWTTTAAWYVAGSMIGGVTLGVVLGAAGQGLAAIASPLSTVAVSAIVASALALALLFDSGALGEKVPSIHRQVNEDWLDMYRNWVYGGGFGWQLGLGVVTIVPTAGTYVTWLMAVLTAKVWMGALIGGAFGLARGLPIVAVASATDPQRLRRFHRRMAAAAPAAHRAVLAVTAVALAGSFAVMLGAA